MGESNHAGQNSEQRFLIRRSVLGDVLWIVSIAAIYFAAIKLSYLFKAGDIATIWPPIGIAFSAILLTPRHRRPSLVGVLFLTDLAGERLAGTSWSASAAYALAVTGDAVLGSWLVLRFVGPPITFRRVRDVLAEHRFVENYGVPGWIMHTHAPYLTNDAAHDPHVVPEIQQTLGFYNLADVPILDRTGTLLGCFEIHNKQGGFTDQDLLVLQSLAATAAVAMENASLLEERQRTQELLQSQSKHLEQLVQERTTELQENIGELEAFSYTIAHDMRAPLRAIIGFTQMLRRQCKDQVDETGAEYLNRTIDAARRMDRLIQDVLSLSQLTRAQFKLEPVDTDKVLQGILSSYPAFQPPQVEIQVQRPLPIVLANEAALTQCISNLLGNAVKFVAPGVRPQIEIWAEESNPPDIKGTPASPAPQPLVVPSVRLWFADNGVGIDPDQRERIFEIFQRVDTSYEGTGIGLAIVRKAMQRMGGKVGVESQVGKGSRFWLEFPSPASRGKITK